MEFHDLATLEPRICLTALAPTYINSTLLLTGQEHKRLFDGDIIALHPEIRFEYARPGWRGLPQGFRDRYALLNRLETRAYFDRFLCAESSTRDIYAVKIFRKESKSDSNVNIAIEREIQIVKTARHPNIIEFKDEFETPTEAFLIFEYLPNGNLFDHVAKSRILPEDDARKVFGQLFEAVKCLVSSISHVPGYDLRPGLTQTENPARQRHHSPRHHARERFPRRRRSSCQAWRVHHGQGH